MRIVECIPEHYEVQEVGGLGRAYRWYPEKVMVECGMCGKREIFKKRDLITSIVTCGGCGAESTAGIREGLLMQRLAEDEAIHPWRYWRSSEDAGIPV